jgi:HK97 family phage portal protein
MAFWDELVTTKPYQAYNGERQYSSAFAAQYPLYEQNSPQYVAPSPYSLAQQGYRTNTLIFACISRRIRAISSAPMWVYNVEQTIPVFAKEHYLMNLLREPNERISERLFWQITQMYLDIAGFSCWEIERNNYGDPIHLWPMRADWCSFMRGNGRPLRAVRYQPYGLPYQDIPIENILLFQYFDPLFPLLKGYSPTMAVLKEIAVDNGMTEFLYKFIMEGARFSGLLTTDQDLDDLEAERIRDRWKTQHGGVNSWNNIAVLGNGAQYQNTSMNFNDMAFPELDGRTEARITAAFEIPAILLGAKIGLKASTLSNYEASRKQWYEEWVSPEWDMLAEQFAMQMLREYDDSGKYKLDSRYQCAFMTKKVSAVQPNRDLAFRRAISAARANVFTRDQALEEIGLDPVDGKRVYIGANIRVGEDPTGYLLSEIEGVDLDDITPGKDDNGEDPGDEPGTPAGQDIGEDTDNVDFSVTSAAFGTGSVHSETDKNGVNPAMALEEKQFRAFARNRIKEGKPDEIKSFKWHYIPEQLRGALMERVIKQ